MIKKKLISLIAGGLLCQLGSAQQVSKVNSDQWSMTDALGRKAVEQEEIAGKKGDKVVAMFYWTWHQGNDDTTYQVKNITEIVRKNPEAMKDYNHRGWGTKKPGFFFWEEPLFGYYKTTDTWVLRRHAEMLADAGVDVVFFDCTNGSLTWQESYEALLKTWDQAQKDGVKVPKIAFMLPFGPVPHSAVSLRQLYQDLYKPGRYQNLWFNWKGKPCIMAYPDNLEKTGVDKEIAEFFTFRPGQPDYVDGPSRKDHWGWLENYPQKGYVRNNEGKFEQVTVGVAQNAGPSTNGHCSAFNLPGTYGRSYSQQHGFDPRVDGYLYGWNFQEQWNRAFELDPELVFITGWNEYTAGQWLPVHSWTGDPFSFVDQYDWEHSRDIEPNKGWGDKGDVYYLQLIDNVRKFKGMEPRDQVSAVKTIKLGKVGEWDNVLPYYTHYKGNTMHRDHRGRYSSYYKNTTGRNDIVGAKVARDANTLFFYVETAEKLSSPGDRNWMMLFIDIDRNKETGWNGYDYIINRQNPRGNKAVVEKNVGGRWEWAEVGVAPMQVRHDKLEIALPKQWLGVKGEALDFEFKWNDNMQENGNIMDFYVNGDTAPGGRFNFVYKVN
ncbi:hypothetical protein [Sphingobacterium psychroaquaticum]|uniref:Glycosyl hydrolase family 71 n=1 Tax=Sphingobacterium psychroaquaticum TaxID=561061 RepID=A0A1X7JBH9_9SPHI|nr:hypothetical protein [Sphingobacterium psychroaquaticum]SMG24734.1 hypothetical protein SAMN05660862_1678 [Sphingobacterium psychroaquaticum]